MKFHTFIYTILFKLSIVLVLFSISSCSSQYREHYISEHSSPAPITGDYYITHKTDGVWVLPDTDIRESIIQSIENAQERIWIQIYMWTDKRIMQAVIDAHARGIDVQILLERNVYGLPKVNIPVYSEFKKAGIPVKYTDSYRFTFTHSKFWIIDNLYFISTGNFTKSFFESNRDFIFYSSDRFTLDFLSQLFLGDMSYLGVDQSGIPDHLVLSPIDARAKIGYLLNNAQKDIKIYTQTLSDPDIINLLKKKKKEGTIVHICTANNESNQISSSGSPIPWVFLKKPYLHGKIVFVDGEDIFIGSQNFTQNSLDNNREVGIIFSNSGSLHDKLMNYFEADCIFE